MLSAELSIPIYLERQLTEISEKADLSMQQLWQLACFSEPMLCVIYENSGEYKKGEIVELAKVSQTAFDEVLYYKGFEAIEWLCREKGINIKPLRKIEIPVQLFENCDSEQWYDISDSFYDVVSKNGRFERMSSLNPPLIIWVNEARLVYEAVEFLESGKIGGGNRRWHHGRMIRGLNDMRYSLIDGMFPGMQGLYCEEYDEYVAKERSDRNQMIEVRWYISQFTKDGMDPMDALNRALRLVNGKPDKRPRSVEGMGFWLKDPIDPSIVFSFIDAHKRTFIKSEMEEKIYDKMKVGNLLDEASEVFFVPEAESFDRYDYQYSFWGEAVATIMSRETGLQFEAFYADPDNAKGNRSCIIFPERPIWEYNEKEKKLSRNMLYQILDRYALELKHSVTTNCYYVMRIDDCDSVNPKKL